MFGIKVLVCLVLLAMCGAATGKNVVCYYSSWATYRWSTGKFDVANINTDLCTHLIYAFAGLERGDIVALDPYLDLPDNWGRDNYGEFTALKNKNPKLKTLLAVGGWNEGSAKYSVMAATAVTRQVFIASAVSMISSHGFDGLDLDWEYPNRRDTVHGEADIENFSLLVKELREEFDKYGWFLSAAVSSVGAMASLSYNIPEISKHLDLINLMTYDMYGAWDTVTGHNAPLHKGTGDFGDPADLYTVDVALQYWIQQGAPLEKLAVGVPFYGRTFTLSSPSVSSVRAPASGPGLGGPFTGTNGFIGYNEFCYKLQTETWNVAYDSLAKVPYAFSGQNWVSYDDTDSIRAKVEYAKSLGVSSIMVWSIETDDFHGLCGDGAWPLLRTINDALDVGESTSPAPESTTSSTDLTSTGSTLESTLHTTETPSTEATPGSTPNAPSTETKPETTPPTDDPSTELTPESTTPTVQSTTGPVTESPSTSSVPESTTSSGICSVTGPTRNPVECTSFYICVFNKNRGLDAVKFMCPIPLHWDQFCYKLQTETWNVAYDSLAKVPYAFSGQNWVSYDDTDSIRAKVEYAKSLGVSSIMVWSIETDDFHGLCGDGAWPLLRTINDALDVGESTSPAPESTTSSTDLTSTGSTLESTLHTTETPSTEATPGSTPNAPSTETKPETTPPTDDPSTELTPESTTPTVQSTTGPVTESPSTSSVPESTTSSGICSVTGPTRNPVECTSFYICVFNKNRGLDAVKFMCPIPLHWDQVNGFCNYPDLANCSVGFE